MPRVASLALHSGSLSLRVATPQAKILQAAFRESPGREKVVLLSGSNSGGVNELGDWATRGSGAVARAG